MHVEPSAVEEDYGRDGNAEELRNGRCEFLAVADLGGHLAVPLVFGVEAPAQIFAGIEGLDYPGAADGLLEAGQNRAHQALGFTASRPKVTGYAGDDEG